MIVTTPRPLESEDGCESYSPKTKSLIRGRFCNLDRVVESMDSSSQVYDLNPIYPFGVGLGWVWIAWLQEEARG